MDEVLAQIQKQVDDKGELHLDAQKTRALVRYLSAAALINREIEGSLERLCEFASRYLKTIHTEGINENFSGIFTDRHD